MKSPLTSYTHWDDNKTWRFNVAIEKQLITHVALKYKISIFLFFLFFGCNKVNEDSDPYDNYMKFQVDGKLKEFNSNSEGDILSQFNLYVSSTNLYSANIVGLKSKSSTSTNNVTIILSDLAEIQNNSTYTNYQSTISDEKQAQNLSLIYFDESGISFICQPFSGSQGYMPSGKITFFEVNRSILRGSFSGVFHNSIYSDSVIISGGEFRAKRVE
jgi:hypothetical protein